MQALTYLGDLAPIRNATPGSKTYDYVSEFIKLRKWAEQQHGTHEYKDDKDYLVPRIVRRDAITMVRWWKDAIRDITGAKQLHREVRKGFTLMELAAYGSLDAVTGDAVLTEADQAEELPWSDAVAFWRGMREMSISIGAAKMVPTLFDHGVLLLESVGEAVDELPERVADTATEAVNVGKDVRAGALTALKWAGIAGGGLLGVYVLARVLPRRPAATATREDAREDVR